MAKEEPTTTRAISAGEFFKPALCGGLIGLIITLVSVLVVGSINDWDKEYLRYKEALFYALVGQEPAQIHKETGEAFRHAECLKKTCVKELSLQKLLQYEKILAFAFDKFASDADDKFTALLNQESIFPPIIIEMAKDWRWHRVRDNEKDMRVVNSLLRGEKPDIQKPHHDYPSLPQGTWLLAISLIQFCGFLVYLIRRANKRSEYRHGWGSYEPPWHKAPWSKPGTYVTLLGLMPGAIPLMLLAGFLSFCSADLKEIWAKRHANKTNGRPQSVILPQFDKSHLESEELLLRLKSRVGR